MFRIRIVGFLLTVSFLSGLSQAVPTNGDFSMLDTYGNPTLDPWTVSGIVSNGGGYAWFEENTDNDRISSLTQTFVIPDGAQKLSFYYQMFSDIIVPPTTDKFIAYLNGDEIFYVDSDNFPSTFEPFSTDVLSLAGQLVQLRFELLSDDDGYITTVRLDNVDVSAVIVPVPSAVVLGGIGIASVRWLRKRRVM
jgi:hypothetical protein